MAVDHSAFALRLRHLARQATRRATLSALLGGALLGGRAMRSDAARKAKRRKTRKRKSGFPRLRPIYIWIQNPGANPVTLAHGDAEWCCHVLNRSITVPPYSRVAVSSGYNANDSYTRGFVWINERYWISFNNAPLQRPDLTSAFDGQPASGWCCLPEPSGTTVVDRRPMSVGAQTSFTHAGHSYWVSREPDTNYIVFTIILPATL
jgi:hypothetical protein